MSCLNKNEPLTYELNKYNPLIYERSFSGTNQPYIGDGKNLSPQIRKFPMPPNKDFKYTPIVKIVDLQTNTSADNYPPENPFNLRDFNKIRTYNYSLDGVADIHSNNYDFKPRLTPEELLLLRKYYYESNIPNAYQKVHHIIKYATPSQLERILKSAREGKYYNDYQIPYNFVEWRGKLYDCAKLAPVDNCLDPLYGSEVHAKCQAQHQFLGRTDGGKCSLQNGCINNQETYNNQQCVYGFDDADKLNLLINNPKAGRQMKEYLNERCGVKKIVNPNSIDFWKNWGYYPSKLEDYVPDNAWRGTF